MIGPLMISAGVVLMALAFRPVGRPQRAVEADELQAVEILDHWAPLSVDRPEQWRLAQGRCDVALLLCRRSIQDPA
jgi:hypothetical protein